MSIRTDQSYFTRRLFFRNVLLSPLAGIGLALAEIGDAILVGHGIGITAIAAIGFFSPLFLLFSFLSFGLSTGGAILYNNLLNEGRKDDALRIFNSFVITGCAVAVVISALCLLFQDNLLGLLGVDSGDGEVYEMAKSYLPFMVLGGSFELITEVLNAYMRNDKDVTFSIVVQTVCGLSNLAISAIMVFVFKWGVAGGSFGFFISNLTGALVSFLYIIFSHGELEFRFRFAPIGNIIKPLRLGFATSAEYVFGAVFNLVFIHILTNLSDVEAVGIYNIIEDISIVFIFMFEMIGKTSQPMFTEYHSEHNEKEENRLFRYCLFYSVILGVAFTVLITVYPQIIDLLFGMEDVSDASKVYYAAAIFDIGSVFMGISLITQNVTQANGDDKGAFMLVFLRQLGFGVPLLLILSMFGDNAIWFVYPLMEILALAVFYVISRIRKSRRKESGANVYCTSFVLNNENLFKELDDIEAFVSGHGVDNNRCSKLRLSLEEICGMIEDHGHNDILIQLSATVDENDSVEVHIRDNISEFNPFSIAAKRIEKKPDGADMVDYHGLGMLIVRYHTRNLLYRYYQGFNTITLQI